MQSPVAFLVLCVAFAVAENPWDTIPECAAAKAANFEIANCPAMGPCIQSIHAKARECVRLESEDPDASVCTNRDDVKGARIAWLKVGCKHHTATAKCMAQEASTAGFDEEATFYARYRRTTPEAEIAEIATKAFGRCWLEVRAKLHECKALGANCEGFNACSGKEPGPADCPWAPISARLKAKKHAAMINYKDKMKSCLTARTQPAVFL